MEIRSMFNRPIDRDLQGVIKVAQTDEEHIYQELDEYVVTKELAGHFNTFFQSYQKGIDGFTDRMGVWISGFFGSGKSHFLKILSYLLENRQVGDKKAVDFFEDKIKDPMVLANIKRAAEVPTDVILFNVESKSVYSRNDKEPLIKVFYKVFYEMLGFYGDKPWVAEMERQLAEEGLYDDFKEAMLELTGVEWEKRRRRILLDRDNVIAALVKVRGMSEESAKEWFDTADDNVALSVENFARSVKEYLAKKEPNHHIVFLVDEMGQYIGDDNQMMLELQTIVEELGVHCQGKAWVIVTSQEDIDSIVKICAKIGDNFSKIQGRFNTRLSLSSANVDEVIKRRLLEKTQTAQDTLMLLYHDQSAILRNLISFVPGTAEMKAYADAKDFSEVYPFVPYQFNTLQKVLNGIRRQGASGKHLSEGERSLLGAFQFAAIQHLTCPIGTLIPFSCFYDSIKEFLESSVSRVIEQAKDNNNLDEFDVEVLKLLFLMRHVKGFPTKVDNLVTLMVSRIDEDKLELREKIQKALRRLVAETLVEKNGDNYVFLTDEEQNINREIKRINIDPHTIANKVGEMIFDEIYNRKRYQYNSEYNFLFRQQIDGRIRGSQDGEIAINIITPYFDGYTELRDEDYKFQSMDGTTVIMKLPPDDAFLEEIVDILKTETYITRNASLQLPEVIREIINTKQYELTGKRERARRFLEESIGQAEVFIKGEKREITTKVPKEKIDRAFKVLIEGIYSKLGYIQKFITTTSELASILTQQKREIVLGDQDPNQQALDEVRFFIEQNHNRNYKASMKAILNRFTAIPYGWKELDIAALIARLLVNQEIQVQYSGESLSADHKELPNYLTKRTEVDKLLIFKRVQVSSELLQKARNIGRDVFDRASLPQDEDGLLKALKEEISKKLDQIKMLELHYTHDKYPGRDILQNGTKLLEGIFAKKDPHLFFEGLAENQQQLSAFVKEFADVDGFFKTPQRMHFDRALYVLDVFRDNEDYILDKELIGIVEEIEEIVNSPRPYSQIVKLPVLRDNFNQKFSQLLEEECQPIKEEIQRDYQEVADALAEYKLDTSFAERTLEPLETLLDKIDSVDNFYKAKAMPSQSRTLKENALNSIRQQLAKNAEDDVEIPIKEIKAVKVRDVLGSRVVIRNEAELDLLLEELRDKLKEYLAGDVEIVLS